MELKALRLFVGDFSKMQMLYPKIKAGRIIRELVHRHIAVAEEMAQRKLASLPEIQIDLSDMEPDDEQPSTTKPVELSRDLSARSGTTDED